jgi:hypothetical protein
MHMTEYKEVSEKSTDQTNFHIPWASNKIKLDKGNELYGIFWLVHGLSSHQLGHAVPDIHVRKI